MIKKCFKCDISTTRKNIVNGEGNLNAKIMFIGEAPGYYEDKLGKPFVGKSGKLLNKYIKLYGFSREEVYITNIIKCRPQGNREPSQKEILNCGKYIIDELKAIAPKIIVTLGNVPLRVITGNNFLYVSKVRGKYYKNDKNNKFILPMYHPSYILRSNKIRYIEEDFQLLYELYKKEVDYFHVKTNKL